MIYKTLKWGRVAIALIFLLLTTFIYLDFRDFIGVESVMKIVWIQFIPSLLNFITLLSFATAGFIVVLVLTTLFGRVYCSTICPLGILQDIISRTGRFLKIHNRYRYRKPSVILRNVILGIVLLSVITGSIILVNIFDPYSMYGKFANSMLRPAGILINNFITGILQNRGVYYLYHIDILPLKLSVLFLPVMIITLLLVMAGKYGRLYCNTICPVGTILGWLSKISLFRIKLNESKCTKCGKCAAVCKSECINIKGLSVDNSSCVTCFNCLTVCPESAIDYKFHKQEVFKSENGPYDTSKRRFLATSLGGVGLLAGSGCSHQKNSDIDPLNVNPTKSPEEKNYPVTPPGSLSIRHFTSLCTACHLCVSQCPTGVLQPSVKEYGLAGFMQPIMDFNVSYCNFECVKCSKICPTGAIMRLSDEAKLTTQVGRVQFTIENCVVYTEDTACGACSEHCPTQAVRMVPYHMGLTIPEIDESICIGCGACEYICPVRPYKAIYVDGNPIHEIAAKPDIEPLEYDAPDAFPF